MTATFRLRVLGRVDARWPDDTAADLTGRKTQALLAYLAVERTRAHTREHLASLLWADTGEARARHNLRQALSKIRQYGSELIRVEGDCVALDADACDVDVIEFERLAGGDDPEALCRALALYRGELLEEFNPREPEYEEWLRLARERLRAIAREAACRRAALLRADGRDGEAIAALHGALAIDPAHEPAHRDLMRLLAAAGRRSEALRQYQACVEALRREFGAEPGPETTRLHAELRQAAPSPAGTAAGGARQADTDHPGVAVLPFENLSSDADGYFVDGITEDLITALSCFNSLLVIARGSCFAYRGRELTDQAIARELGAQFLVRGSVQRVDKRVRIHAQLLDAVAGLNVWAHRFDRELEDVFVLQDEITSTLVSTLAGRVEAARLAHARRAPPERLDAYDFLLRGKDHHHRFTASDCVICIEMFEQAIEHDPSYAAAYAWLGCGLGQLLAFGLGEPDEILTRVQAACERGLELDPNESECHRVLAQVNLLRHAVETAEWHQERALFLNPNDDRSVCAMGEILAFAGRPAEAEQWVRKAIRLNPYHPPRYWTHLGRALFHQGHPADALAAFDKVGKSRSDDLAYRVASAALLADATAASRATDELRRRFPDFDAARFVAGLAFRREDDRRALLEPLLAGLRG